MGPHGMGTRRDARPRTGVGGGPAKPMELNGGRIWISVSSRQLAVTNPSSTRRPALQVALIALLLCSIGETVLALHENLCLEDDYTNDLPIFIEKQTICNFETVPVLVYAIKTTPDSNGNKYCLKGESAEKFNISKEKEVKLYERLAQPETNLRLQIIRTSNDIIGTPTERRQAINAIQFNLNIEDCNQVSWQTIVVAVLSSVCVALMSSLAIMLILYQQKGLIKTSNDDEKPDDRNPTFAANIRDESFINPRRTSSYEFSTISRNSTSGITQETENL